MNKALIRSNGLFHSGNQNVREALGNAPITLHNGCGVSIPLAKTHCQLQSIPKIKFSSCSYFFSPHLLASYALSFFQANNIECFNLGPILDTFGPSHEKWSRSMNLL